MTSDLFILYINFMYLIVQTQTVCSIVQQSLFLLNHTK